METMTFGFGVMKARAVPVAMESGGGVGEDLAQHLAIGNSLSRFRLVREFLGFWNIHDVCSIAFQNVLHEILAVVVSSVVRPEVGTIVLSALIFLGVLEEGVYRQKVLEMDAELLVGIGFVFRDLDCGVLLQSILLPIAESQDGIRMIDVIVS